MWMCLTEMNSPHSHSDTFCFEVHEFACEFAQQSWIVKAESRECIPGTERVNAIPMCNTVHSNFNLDLMERG